MFPTDAPPNIQQWFGNPSLKMDFSPTEDRLDKIAVEVAKRPVREVDFKLLGLAGKLCLVGSNNEVIPQPSAKAPIVARNVLLGIVSFVVFLLGLGLKNGYIEQYPKYFAETANSSILTFCAWTLPLLMWPLMGFLTAQVWRLSRWLGLGIPSRPVYRGDADRIGKPDTLTLKTPDKPSRQETPPARNSSATCCCKREGTAPRRASSPMKSCSGRCRRNRIGKHFAHT